jgi:hypothetical protein
MIPREHDPNSHDHAQDKSDDETKTGRVPDGTFAQVKDSGRLVLVHGLNLHLCLTRTTAVAQNLSGDDTATI